jgi:hypothetical protein
VTPDTASARERAVLRRPGSWSRWSAGPGRSLRVNADPQAEYAQRIAMILNDGVLQDAVSLGLEGQGQFEVDVLDVLDALNGAHLKLVVDERDEVSEASAALIRTRSRK